MNKEEYYITLEENVKRVQEYIKEKIRKSFNYDYGISGKASDRLFTETVIEMQIISAMLDGDKNLGLCEGNGDICE